MLAFVTFQIISLSAQISCTGHSMDQSVSFQIRSLNNRVSTQVTFEECFSGMNPLVSLKITSCSAGVLALYTTELKSFSLDDG